MTDTLPVVAILGAKGVGKRSLVKTAVEASSPASPTEHQAEGADVSKITVVMESQASSGSEMAGGETVEIETEVLAEQEVTDENLEGCEAIMLLFAVDSTESFQRAVRMRNRINRQWSDTNALVPVMVVGTKTDLVGQRVVSRHEGQAFAAHFFSNRTNPALQAVPFVEVTTKDRKTINEAFVQMVKELRRCEAYTEELNKPKDRQFGLVIKLVIASFCCFLCIVIGTLYISRKYFGGSLGNDSPDGGDEL